MSRLREDMCHRKEIPESTNRFKGNKTTRDKENIVSYFYRRYKILPFVTKNIFDVYVKQDTLSKFLLLHSNAI